MLIREDIFMNGETLTKHNFALNKVCVERDTAGNNMIYTLRAR